MCGFVGFFRNGWDGERTAAIRAMADQIRHRGPDQDDYYVDDEIAMGFRRLSIIDLEGGSQPIQNEDGSKVLTFNGEIYNFQELRGELLEKGHRFKTKTDSEVLLHGYEEWGAGLLQRLRGMYAFVIWDSQAHKLFGAPGYFRHQALLLLSKKWGFLLWVRNQILPGTPPFCQGAERGAPARIPLL